MFGVNAHPQNVITWQKCGHFPMKKMVQEQLMTLFLVKFGCIHPPLFLNVAIDHVIPDILHLYLRITDVLFNLLISDIQRYDAILTSSDND